MSARHKSRRIGETITDPQEIEFLRCMNALPPDAFEAAVTLLVEFGSGKDLRGAAYRFKRSCGLSDAAAKAEVEQIGAELDAASRARS